MVIWLFEYLVINVFIQWYSRATGHILPLTYSSPSNISSIWIENGDPTQSFRKCLIIYSQPDFAVWWIFVRLRSGRAGSSTY